MFPQFTLVEAVSLLRVAEQPGTRRGRVTASCKSVVGVAAAKYALLDIRSTFAVMDGSSEMSLTMRPLSTFGCFSSFINSGTTFGAGGSIFTLLM
jgi:hypothetical protein